MRKGGGSQLYTNGSEHVGGGRYDRGETEQDGGRLGSPRALAPISRPPGLDPFCSVAIVVCWWDPRPPVSSDTMRPYQHRCPRSLRAHAQEEDPDHRRPYQAPLIGGAIKIGCIRNPMETRPRDQWLQRSKHAPTLSPIVQSGRPVNQRLGQGRVDSPLDRRSVAFRGRVSEGLSRLPSSAAMRCYRDAASSFDRVNVE